MVFAVSVDHPVFSVRADLQFEGGNKVILLRFLRNGALCGNAGKHLQSMEVHLFGERKVLNFYLIRK